MSAADDAAARTAPQVKGAAALRAYDLEVGQLVQVTTLEPLAGAWLFGVVSLRSTDRVLVLEPKTGGSVQRVTWSSIVRILDAPTDGS